MNLVSNFAGEISASMFNGNSQGVTQSLDMDNKTFENLLEKQMQNKIDNINMYDIPAGLNIGDIDGYDNQVNTVKTVDSAETGKFSNNENYSTSEVLTFFPSVFDSKPNLTGATNKLFDFERKIAATSYGKGARNIVTDISEFVIDALKIS